jgi:zinc transport system ATP-binding protein
MGNTTQILCKDLAIGYEDGTIAKDINFQINSGDYLCILGDNGSGKTTLMKTLLGINQAIGGEIIFENGFSRREIGYLPQQTAVQRDFPASVEEIVLSGCLVKCGHRPFYSSQQRKEAFANMKKLGIEKFAHKSYRKLSGGQQQRVLLARALCAAGKMLVLDEPTAGLDSSSTEEMYRYIESLNKEGVTIVMVSHDLDAALKYASHILNFKGDGVAFYDNE